MVSAILTTAVVGALLVPVLPATQAAAAAPAVPGQVLDEDAILAAQDLDQPQWYKDNIPFIDTPDEAMDAVYYYRWSTFKRAQRHTVPGTGYVSTEYDVPIGYSGNPYTALPDATGYHIMDGRWAADQTYTDDYVDFYLNGAGVPGTLNFSEWIIDATFQQALVTGDRTGLAARLPDLIALYDRWNGRLDTNFPLNGSGSGSSLYWQSPLSDATEYTETSMKSANWFGGGAGYRPTINAYMFAAATAISRIAADSGQTATATEYAARAASLKAGVQNSLWDPQRQFFFQVYNQQDGSNGALQGTRTSWRELMGYAPWAYNLPDAQYSSAWQYLMKPENFGAAFGPTTLERFHDLEAEQGTVVHANQFSSPTASNGKYIGQLDFADSSVSFSVDAPGAGTYPVRVHYANGTGSPSTHLLTVNGSSTPITVTYPATAAWQTFADTQYVTVDVPMNAGTNTLKLAKGTGFAEIDRIATNPYFNFEAIPAQPNREDANCCHWNGPTWPYQTSQVLDGLANLLTNYPAQPYVTAADYREMVSDFTRFQFKDGKPYVAEAGDGDTGKWIYDGFNFSENYNHSSYIDVLLSGLFGIKPQAGNTLELKPLVDPTWTHFAVQDIPYHGHELSIVWDRDGSVYGAGAGLQVFQDGRSAYSSPTLGNTTITIDPPVTAPATQKLMNVAANPLTMEQDWLNRPITQPFPRAFASYTNTVSNGPRCHSGQVCRPTTFDQPMRATDGWIRYDTIPDDRWTNAGSSDPTDHLGVDFGAVRPIRQLSIHTYDDGDTVRAPAAFDAQYLDGTTWRSIPGQTKSPAAPRANDVNTVEFPTVFTSQVRVVFTPQPGKFVGVTELESWYPQSATARILNKNSGLELAGGDQSLPYGASVTQQDTTGAATHQWDVVPAENGFYKIVNAANGFVLGVRDASTAAGADGLQWVDNLTRDHLWSIVDAGGGWSKLVNANSGLVLGVDGASKAAGAVTKQWTDSGTDDHLWRIVVADTTSAYAVESQAGGLMLAVHVGSTADGAAIVAAAPGGTTDQRWTLTPSAGGTVQIVNRNSGKVVRATGTDGVVQTSAVDSAETRWQVVGSGDGYHRLVNVATSRALTVGGTAGGSAVTQQPVSTAPSQRWLLTVDNTTTTPPVVIAPGVGTTLTSNATPTADGWYTQPVLVTLTVPAGTRAQYRINGAATWNGYSRPLTIGTTGANTVETRLLRDGVVVDGSAGSTPVKVDNRLPTSTVSLSPNTTSGTPRNPVTLTFTGADVGSGVARTEYQDNGGAWTAATGPVALTAVGSHLIGHRSVDTAGNTGPIRNLAVTLRADTATSVKVTTRTVAAGGYTTLVLAGYTRYTPVSTTMAAANGTPIALGSVATDIAGAARITVQVPPGTAAGSYTLTGRDTAGNTATATVTVTR